MNRSGSRWAFWLLLALACILVALFAGIAADLVSLWTG
jgi:hypothetical protein